MAEVDEFIPFDFSEPQPCLTHKTLADDDLRALERGTGLERYRFDLAMDLRRHGDTRFISQRTGRAHSKASGTTEFPWLNIAVESEGDQRGVAKRRHFSNDLVSLVDAIVAECEPGSELIADLPARQLPSAALDLVENYDRPLVCVHPAAGDEIRRWPAVYFAELIDLLVERDDVHVAIIGVAGDQEIARKVLQTVRHRSPRSPTSRERSNFPTLSRCCRLPRCSSGTTVARSTWRRAWVSRLWASILPMSIPVNGAPWGGGLSRYGAG